MASPNGADAGARYRDRSRLEVADQPALVLAALAAAQGRGASTISGALRSRDTELMLDALQTWACASTVWVRN